MKARKLETTKTADGAASLNASTLGRPHAGATQLLILTGATLLTLWPLCGGEFTSWDDYTTVAQNPTLNPPTFDSLKVWWTTANLDLWDPVTDMLRGALALVGKTTSPDPAAGTQLNPYVYHSANLLLHIGTVLVVYQILVLLLSNVHSPSEQLQKTMLKPALRAKTLWAACAGALLFAIHPVQVESVGWVTAMKDLLCGLLSLVALWRYLISANCGNRRYWEFWIATLFFVLATLSKPTAVVLPVIVIVINRWILNRPVRQAWRGMTLWITLGLPAVIVTKIVQPAIDTGSVAWWRRPLVAADALAFYLYKLLWPASMGLDYGRRPQWIFQHGFAWWTWIVPAAVAVLLWIFRRHLPVLVAGAMTFVLGLLPVLGLVRFDFQRFSTVSDHYLYLSMFGIALAVAWGLTIVGGRSAPLAVVVWLALLGVRSWRQSWVWQSSETLFVHTIEVNPDSAAAYSSLAELERHRGMTVQAEAFARKSVQLRPDLAPGFVTLGAIYEEQGRVDEAIVVCRAACEIEPDVAAGFTNLSILLARNGQLAEAEAMARRAVKLEPGDATAHINLGLLEAQEGHVAMGVRDMEEAVRLEPNNALAQTNLGALLAREGRRGEAIAHFRAALQIDPDFPPARNGIARLTGTKAAH